MSRSFYTAVTQQVLLFGAESWVLTGKMESALDAFQGRVSRRLTGRQTRRGNDGKWFYPSLGWALKEAGVLRVRTSILRRQNTVAQFISTRPILGLCDVAERRRGTRVPLRCRLRPGRLPVYARLLPPSLGYPCPPPSLRHITEPQNRPRRNKLRDRILSPED